jgi:hypothetical protein
METFSESSVGGSLESFLAALISFRPGFDFFPSRLCFHSAQSLKSFRAPGLQARRENTQTPAIPLAEQAVNN